MPKAFIKTEAKLIAIALSKSGKAAAAVAGVIAAVLVLAFFIRHGLIAVVACIAFCAVARFIGVEARFILSAVTRSAPSSAVSDSMIIAGLSYSAYAVGRSSIESTLRIDGSSVPLASAFCGFLTIGVVLALLYTIVWLYILIMLLLNKESQRAGPRQRLLIYTVAALVLTGLLSMPWLNSIGGLINGAERNIRIIAQIEGSTVLPDKCERYEWVRRVVRIGDGKVIAIGAHPWKIATIRCDL